MKRNLVPLLAVAFVVAIASTGIFYGLFVGKLKSAPVQTVVIAARPLLPGTKVTKDDLSVMQWAAGEIPKGMFTSPDELLGQTVLQSIESGEPVLQSRFASKSGSGIGIPEGMRAVSVHVSDSSGVLSLLRPGHKVDIQVFTGKQTPESEARTALQNITVLAAGSQPEPSSQGSFTAPVVTLLVTPKEADLLGVADSFGRLRLALRNPVDQGRESKPATPFAAVFRNAPAEVAATATKADQPAAPQTALSTHRVRSQVGLAVELLSATPEAMEALKRFGVGGKQGALDASVPSQSGEVEKVLATLRESKSVDLLSLSKVNAAVSRTASVELQGRDAGGVRVQFSPFLANGQMKMKVQPELSEGGAGVRRIETEVNITAGRSFVISGLKDSLTPASTRQLLVLVTPNL